MALKHDNPTKPRIDKDRNKIWAKAPYNFVPLAEKVVEARPPLKQDKYEGLTGWIECELETCSPTYIRGMLTETEHNEQGQKKPDDLSVEEKEARAPFFATTEETIEGRPKPVIPGSSLRGMIRSLVEVIGYGRIRWVGKEPTFTFRAVAAQRDDPLRDPYRDIIGAFARNVDVGYLEKNGDGWRIRPALSPAKYNWPDKTAFLKVKERYIDSKDIPGYLHFNSSKYRPQLHKVSFNVEFRSGRRGRHVALSQIGPRDKSYQYEGVLVCSGNMLETGKADQKSPRRNHALVLGPDESATPLKISKQTLDDHINGMTPYQRDELKDWGGGPGCLPLAGDLRQKNVKEASYISFVGEDGTIFGPPVFYVAEGNKVVCFGHCPNFRVPAPLNGDIKNRAATPFDLIPNTNWEPAGPDLADAIFGWVQEDDYPVEGQCAGRVFFEDAHLASADKIWLSSEIITPHTLSGPKPTTFQHYLVQNKRAGHNADKKESLAHYGSRRGSTQIRGHKLYWIKGNLPDIKASTEERQHESQLTRILPLKPEIRFSFKVRFENLREEELGAILWAMSLPGDADKEYRHRLGMGKPLGMGTVSLKNLVVRKTQRTERYKSLFEGNTWYQADEVIEPGQYIKKFETYILEKLGFSDEQRKKVNLADLERIQELLTMVEWREGEGNWLEQTRYMEIERGLEKLNEYKERPVLPTPQGVIELASGQTPREARPKRESSDYETGTVKKFGLGKGNSYGFIEPDDKGKDIFVHISNLSGGLQTLEPGQRVRFKVGKDKRGRHAIDVSLDG